MSRKTDQSIQIDQHVGGRIRYYRLQAGLSQQELADSLGISYQQLHKYENGSNSVSASRLADIAGLLGSQVHHFFEGFEADSAQEAAPHQLRDVTGGIQSREQLQLLQYLKSIKDPITRQTLHTLLESLTDSGMASAKPSADRA